MRIASRSLGAGIGPRDWSPSAGGESAHITDLRVHADDLTAATQGRAFWILDDLTPLHQLDGTLSDVALLKPRPAYRVPSRSGSAETGQNPPDGALIHYLLPEPADNSAELKLEILDSAGKTLRRFGTQAANQDPATLVKGVLRPQPDQPLTIKAGMNRYVWDLRYPRYTEVGDTIRYVSRSAAGSAGNVSAAADVR